MFIFYFVIFLKKEPSRIVTKFKLANAQSLMSTMSVCLTQDLCSSDWPQPSECLDTG